MKIPEHVLDAARPRYEARTRGKQLDLETWFTRDARKLFSVHVNNCKGKLDANKNPVEMRLTFDEWLSLWLESGVWETKRENPYKFVMARTGDLGHYELGNVRICTQQENAQERTKTYKNYVQKAKNVV